jgi:general secretion pathway protein D
MNALRRTVSIAATLAVAAAFLLASAVPAGSQGQAQPTAKQEKQARGGDGKFTIHFENVELPIFVKFISRATGRNFVFAEKVAGTVTVVSPHPVTADEAFAVFQSVLAVRGLTMIDDGIVTRVVPLKEARTGGSHVINNDRRHTGFATRLLPLKHVAADDVSRVLEALVSKEGALVAYAATNTLIATDTVPNLNRMSDVVAALDVAGNQHSIEVISLEHADAESVAAHISAMLVEAPKRVAVSAKDKSGGLSTAQGQQFKVVADTRTNSLIVTAGAMQMRKIRDLAMDLDSPLRPGDERIHVYYARYAHAEDLVEVVRGTISSSSGRRGQTRINDPGAGNKANGGMQHGVTSALGENINVSVDLATNSVIIAASNQDYQTIRSLLESLDIPRPQVFVEAIIAEVSLTRAREFGVELQGGFDVGDGTVFLRSNLSVLNALGGVGALAGLGGAIAAATSDKTVEGPDGTEIPAQAAIIRALDEDGDVEILSAPTLLTLDNEEAEIHVGQNVPFVTGQGVDSSQISNVFTTVERQDVGIKLRIKPQVTEGDTVVLEVEEEVSAMVLNPLLDANTLGPTLTIRSARTTVSVADGRTVIIGGLIADSIAKRDSKVPILGDIPFLGRLFRVDSDANEKVNLLVILTPHIIRTTEDLQIVSERKQQRFDTEVPDVHLDLPTISPPTETPERSPEELPQRIPSAADTGGRYIIPSDNSADGP